MGLAFFLGSHSNTELDMQVRREALRKRKGKGRCGGSKRRKQWREMRQHFSPETPARRPPLSLWSNGCAGRRQGARREGTEGKGEERQGKKKSTKQAPGRYSEAKNVLKTTC